MNHWLRISILLVLPGMATAQVGTVREPSFSQFTPVWGSQATQGSGYSYQSSQPAQTLGATASSVYAGQQRSAHYRDARQQDELEEVLQEIRKELPNRQQGPPTRATSETDRKFRAALTGLQRMLSGKAPLSIAGAWYIKESVFADPYLTRRQYDDIVNESAAFIRAWMQQNDLDIKDRYAVHVAIQKFMSEPLTITRSAKNKDGAQSLQTVTHQPFGYDYHDFAGEKDHRNSFLTKCLATGYGQCASLPAVYLVLAEKLSVPAHLTFAPLHSFIKYPDNQGNLLNYEPTSNWEISDGWYKDNLFISPQAVNSGIYLDTLSKKQVVASCIFDLAVAYMHSKGTNDSFILECLHAGVPLFPRNNNLQSLFLYSVYLRSALRREMIKHQITEQEIPHVPSAARLYREYLGNEAYITRLGYQELPAGLYDGLIREHEFKGRAQQKIIHSAKEKRDLFRRTTR